MRNPNPSTSYRNFVIRSATALIGDLALTAAMVQACSWVIEAAALGLFLQFMVWLLAAILALALSQYLIHPVVNLLMADDKLDRTIDTLAKLRRGVERHFASVDPERWLDVLAAFGNRAKRA